MKKRNIKRIVAFAAILMLLLTTFSATLLVAQAEQTAVIDETQQVSLTIHKYAVPDDGTDDYGLIGISAAVTGAELAEQPTYDGLADVDFSAYLIPDTVAGDALEALVDTTTIPDAASYTPAEIVTTNEDGVAVFEDVENGGHLDQGRYLIVETGTPAHVTAKSVNFIVDLPYTNAAGDEYIYDVHVYPKNYTVLGKVELTKTFEGQTMEADLSATFKLQGHDGADYVDMPSPYDNLTTNSEGKIIVDDLHAGTYRFIEVAAPTGYGINTTPIEFTITQDASEGVVTREADNKKLPTIAKGVSADGIDFSEVVSVNAGEPATWRITPEIPTDIEDYDLFTVEEIVDSRLDIVADSVVVKLGTDTLAENTDYTLLISGNSITVKFIDDIVTIPALDPNKELNITYQTTIDMTQDNVLGTDIGGSTSLNYNNRYTGILTAVSDEANVYTGGAYMEVVDSNTNQPLIGAVIKLYATEADAKAGTAPIATLTSGTNGEVLFKGLAYNGPGEAYNTGGRDYYFVVETAPSGYHLPGEVLSVTVNHDSHKDDSTTPQIELLVKSKLPLTGGQGTLMFYLVGISLIALATIIFVQYKKRSN